MDRVLALIITSTRGLEDNLKVGNETERLGEVFSSTYRLAPSLAVELRACFERPRGPGLIGTALEVHGRASLQPPAGLRGSVFRDLGKPSLYSLMHFSGSTGVLINYVGLLS